jgi:hypothetical protein
MYKEVYNCYTCPEIEYLLILHYCDVRRFKKEKSKPCEFCKKYYGYSKSREKKYFTNSFSAEELVLMLKQYDSQCEKDELSLYSLVKAN